MRLTQFCKNPELIPIQWFIQLKPACPFFLIFHFLIGRLQTVNTCTSLIELFPTCDEWNGLWQRQISLPLQIKRVIGSWYRDIVSLPFCLHYQAFWNRVGGVGGGELFDHWSPWPCLKGLNLSWPYQGIFFLSQGDGVGVYQERGCCGEIDRGVFPLEWRWRDVMSLQGNMHAHAHKVCKSEVWKLIQGVLIFLTV